MYFPWRGSHLTIYAQNRHQNGTTRGSEEGGGRTWLEGSKHEKVSSAVELASWEDLAAEMMGA